MDDAQTSPASSADLFKNLASGQENDQTQEAKTEEATSTEQLPDELAVLKQRAKVMGISFSNNIGVDALKAKIQEKLDGDAKQEEAKQQAIASNNIDATQILTPQLSAAPDPQIQSLTVASTVQASVQSSAQKAVSPAQKTKSLRQQLHEEQMRLVRVRITNLNPNKKNLPGEIFTFANEVLGAVKKFIPYGEATDNGYHIPFCIYTQLKEREFLNIKTRKDSRGRTIVETGMAREFAIEELPPLTSAELAKLAAAQAAAAGLSD